MLQAMRDKATGVLGWIVVGLIIVTFALFGLGSYLQDQSMLYAAKVNDVEISNRDWQQAYQQRRIQMENQMGDAFDPAKLNETLMKKTALDSLIQKQLLLQHSEAEGLTVSDQYLANFIHSIPELQEEGVFSADRYNRLLSNQGTKPAKFEANTRERLLSSQLLQGLSSTSFVTDPEVRNVYKLQNQKRDFDYLTVSHMAMLGTAEVKIEEAEKFFNDNPDKFMDAEKVKLATITLHKAALAEGIEIEASDLQDFYAEKKQTLVKQEQRRASHILIQLDADADEAAVEVAQNKATDVLKKILDGESFAEVAKQNSDDPGSAEQGGDVGFFARGAMVPEFDAEVFSMQVNDISEPVKSQFGFHIIKLTEIQASKIFTFEEAKADLEMELKNNEVEDIYYSQIEQLTDLVFENPESLQPAADALGLTIDTTDWLWRDNPTGLGLYPKVIAAAFSEDVLEAGNNSEPIEISSDEIVVIRVLEHKAESLKKFDTVVDSLLADLKVKKASELAKSKGEELLQQVRDGKPLKDLEKAEEFKFSEAKQVTLGTQGYSQDILRGAFQLQKPANEDAVLDGYALTNGDYVIVNLKAVHDVDLENIPETDSMLLRRGLESVHQQTAVFSLVAALRSRAAIEISESEE